MVTRTSWKRYFYIGFALILLISCWEAGRNHSVAFASGAKDAAGNRIEFIPKDSIRLRILANSDSPADQWIKREVRDAIVEQMKQWVDEPQGIEAAREAVRTHLPELNELVGSTLSTHGFSDAYEVELGIVPFPAKMYGSQVYPAGDYEALRVTIGTAEGQNWWCVLFPPLCFVDSEAIVKRTDAGDKTAKAEPDKANKESVAPMKTTAQSKQGSGSKLGANEQSAAVTSGSRQPEVRFFMWDLFKKLGALFA